MNEIQIFKNEEFGTIRTLEINGQPYFVGTDVAKALGYKFPKDAIRDNVEEEDKMVLSKKYCDEFLKRANASLENFPNRGLTIINESGLYSLILASKLPSAKKFKHWVTAEVLPSIRRTGAYGSSISDERIYKKLELLEQKIDALEKKSGDISEETIKALIPCFYVLDSKIESVAKTIIRAVSGNVKLLAVYIDYLIKMLK